MSDGTGIATFVQPSDLMLRLGRSPGFWLGRAAVAEPKKAAIFERIAIAVARGEPLSEEALRFLRPSCERVFRS